MRIQRRAEGRRRRRGVALIYAVFGAFVAAGMVSVMFTMAGVTNQRSEVKRSRVEARYLAEGAIEAAKKEVVTAIANWDEVPTAGTISIDGQTVSWTVENVGDQRIVEDASGIQTLIDSYEIGAAVEVNGIDVIAHRLVNAESTPVFQFAVFYTNDLEILPGPSMELGGRVHTNGDMYLGTNSTMTMNTNYLRSLGDIYRRRKDSNSSKGNVLVRQWVQNPFSGLEPEVYFPMKNRGDMSDDEGVSTESGYDSQFTEGFDAEGDGDYYGEDDWLPFAAGALEYWKQPTDYVIDTGYTVKTGEHGVVEAVTPNIGSIAMFEESEVGTYALDEETGRYEEVGADGTHAKGHFHENAGLSIIVYEDGTFEAFQLGDDDPIIDPDLLSAIQVGSMADMRQSDSQPQHVPVVSVDMAKLNSSDYFPSNGLLYASHYGMGEGLDAKGLLLYNGAELQDKLTVVTEGAAYLQGDYNTVDKVGASVIGDAVNLLSNSWDNTKTPGTLPLATETSFNCAMITGNHDTVGSQYNGGLENLPRFHEKWTGVRCNIKGSFVNTWESDYATGLWTYGDDRYKAPLRTWSYDTLFNRVDDLPPFTPMAVTAEDVVTW